MQIKYNFSSTLWEVWTPKSATDSTLELSFTFATTAELETALNI